jgi:hypothetical protein
LAVPVVADTVKTWERDGPLVRLELPVKEKQAVTAQTQTLIMRLVGAEALEQ